MSANAQPLTARSNGTSQAFALLEAGVPLTLLLDLAALDLGLSQDVAREERADTAWVYTAA